MSRELALELNNPIPENSSLIAEGISYTAILSKKSLPFFNNNIFRERQINDSEYTFHFENNADGSMKIEYMLKSIRAMYALRDYIEKMLLDKNLLRDASPVDLCPISLRLPRDPCYLKESATRVRYERVDLEQAMAINPADPMTNLRLQDVTILSDDQMKARNRGICPMPLADMIADYYAVYKSCSAQVLFTRSRNTKMDEKGNPLIEEFLKRFSEETVRNVNSSPDGVRQAIYEILQDYQRDLRRHGDSKDWKLAREERAGLFGSIGGHFIGGSKEFIFDGGLSISESRRRLFIIDGLSDAAIYSDVITPAAGTVLEALSPANPVHDYLQIQKILEHFGQPSALASTLRRRCQEAKIDPNENTLALLGNARLGKFIHFVRMTLELHFLNERQKEYERKNIAVPATKKQAVKKPEKAFRHIPKRSGFKITKAQRQLIKKIQPKPPAPLPPPPSLTAARSSNDHGIMASTFLMIAATGCGSGCAFGGCGAGCGLHGCGGGCGGHGCGGHGCGGGGGCGSGCGGGGCGGGCGGCGGG